MAPRISCLIPVYNCRAYLREALDSIAAQTFTDFEIVIVDDGSTDGSSEILAEFAAARPGVTVVTQPNGGIVAALNHGLRHCTGDLVARMDGDDVALPRRFEIQVEWFDRNPDAVAVGGALVPIDAAGDALGGAVSASPGTRTRLDVFPPRVANVQHSLGTFRRAAIVAVGGYRGTFPHAEDYDLYLRLAPHGLFLNPPDVVLHYRILASSLSNKHLVQQETSAVLAEISAYARLAGRPDPGDEGRPLSLAEYAERLGPEICPPGTMQRYVDFRVWRRMFGLRDRAAGGRRVRLLRQIVDPRNALTGKDRALSARILGSMGKNSMRLLRDNFAMRGGVRPLGRQAR